jgi:hypothetical protein
LENWRRGGGGGKFLFALGPKNSLGGPDLILKSTCDVNLLSKLSIIFKEWRVIVLFVLLRSHKVQTI